MDAYPSPDDMQDRMRQARRNLDSHSDEIVRQAREQLDWRKFIVKHPFLVMGAAAAAGYLLAPRRVHLKCIDEQTVKKTVEQAMGHSQPASAGPVSGLVGGLASMVMGMVVREGASFASQLVRNFLDSQLARSSERRNASSQQAATMMGAGQKVPTNGEHR